MKRIKVYHDNHCQIAKNSGIWFYIDYFRQLNVNEINVTINEFNEINRF